MHAGVQGTEGWIIGRREPGHYPVRLTCYAWQALPQLAQQ